MNVTNVTVVHNAKSGSALTVEDIRKKFDDNGIVCDTMIAISDTIKSDLAPHVKDGSVIVAIGGDGTINAVAGLVINTGAILAPLPGGTLNHFTKDLGINQDIDEAIANIKRSEIISIDAAMVNDLVFINNSSIGLYPSSLRVREQIEEQIGKWPAAVIGIARAFVRYRSYRITINGTTFKTPFVFVGNNNYHLDKPGTPRSRMDEGLLSAYMIDSTSRLTLLKLLPYALTGKLNDHESFHSFTPTEFTISTRRSKISVSHDGEVSRLTTPLNYKVLPKSIKVIGSS